ncbi:11817_t:CDS:2 [Racocetra fulgida]|uniref:11817_t:CDS:1 n=1 Tax=Racocetra fulgida TaxID=60492 RepID=A0A9N9G0T1_9GLOM|nr:11817_t:CDS:2 [Racocetra fulgida]
MECNLCKKPTSKRCSRCKIKYYCSKSCQKNDYANHILVCPQRSADIHVKGVFQLPLNIKKAYDDGGYTSEYYKWFLKNEHLLQDLSKYEGERSLEPLADKMISLVKPYLSEHDLSEHDQAVLSSSLPDSKRHICIFYLMILQGYLPRIEQPHWIDFGFCACKVSDNYHREFILNTVHIPILSAGNCELAEEVRLKNLYQELIVQKGCKIDEFNDAYISGTVLDLIKRKYDKTNTSWLSASKIETFGYNQPVKSVYNLKQYILSNSVDMVPAVMVDYGFGNCRTKDEEKQLKNMYEKLIFAPQFDAISLHKACIAGKIFEYVSSILPNDVLRVDLLRNLYPLEEY